jgi:nitrite reductase/ring-hydroxylating ferredoxin subunit
MADLDRRGFLTMAAGFCAACALGDTLLAATNSAKPVEVGSLEDYKKLTVNDQYAKSPEGFFLVNEDGKLVAISSRCTHKGFTVVANNDGSLTCPKHHSEFSSHGTVTKGQAKSTLPRYAITVNGGKVVVDTTRSFSEKQFDAKDASVELPK